MKNILLVEPEFPIPAKSKNHSNFLPIGLLKLASYYRRKGCKVKLNRGNIAASFTPDRILISSLFTYWSSYVKESVQYYKKRYPSARIEVGGVYATLMPKHCKEYTGCNKVFTEQHKGADKCMPAYDLVDVDYQIIHGMRGCSRKCLFCGIWRIESQSFKNARQIEREICKNKLVFYDNNILINPYIEEILDMLASKIYNKRVIQCECQSGLDGRVLIQKPHLARKFKKARFRNIRMAWDFPYNKRNVKDAEEWINLLEEVGYNRKEIYIFMIYNWNYSEEQLLKKREQCYEWGVQVADCRYRPLNQTFDNYNPRAKEQTGEDYFIHPSWSDASIRKFRRDVRKHNICIRQKIPWSKYDASLERLLSRKKLLDIKQQNTGIVEDKRLRGIIIKTARKKDSVVSPELFLNQ